MADHNNKSENAPLVGVVISVLGYREGKRYVAHALEMDLRGFGSNFKEALRDLDDMVHSQISFAYFKKQPEIINRPADPALWKMYYDIKTRMLKALARKKTEEKREEFMTAGIEVPAAWTLPRSKYDLSDNA